MLFFFISLKDMFMLGFANGEYHWWSIQVKHDSIFNEIYN